MADFTINGEFGINAQKAFDAVRKVGSMVDGIFSGKESINVDTKAAEKEIKNLGAIADKTFKDIGDSAGKNIGGAGLFDGLKKSFAEGQDAANSGGGIFGSLAGGLGQLITPAGAATAAIGAVTAGLAKAFTVGQEYEQGLAGLSAITGLTGDALNDIGDRAKNLAITFGGDVSTQISSFQGVLSRFGADLAKTPGDLQKVSENINILAKAGGIDAAAAMDTLTGAMLQFGVNTSNSSELAAESSRFINVMAASARVGAAEIPQVGEAITVAGVAMKKAKVSFEEGNASIQVLAAGGKFGAEAGTALRNVLGKIAGEEVIPKEALAKMKSLGINMKIVADTSLPLEARLKELGKGAKDATAFTQLFGAENSAAATILASGADQVGAWTKEITGTSDATKQAAVNMGTLSEQISRGKAQIEVFAINTFQLLNPIVSEISGAIIQAFGVIVDVLKPTFDKLVGTFSNVFNRISSVLKPILAFLGGSLLANFTIIFASIGEIINSFYTTVVTIFDGIVDAVEPIIVAFKKAFNITDDVTKSFDPLKTFQQILSFITTTISDLGNILTAVGGFIAQALLVPFQLAGAAIAKVIEWVVDLNNWLNELTGTATDTGKTTASLSEYFDTFINIIKQAPEIIRAVTAGFKAFVGGITDLISNFSFDKLKDLISGKTIAAAFTGSLNDSELKKQNELLLSQYEKSLTGLAALQEKANLAKDAKQKEADAKLFNAEKERLIKSINDKEKLHLLEPEQAAKLRTKVLDTLLAADKKEQAATIAALDADGKDKKTKLKDIAKEISDTEIEARKVRNQTLVEADKTQFSDAQIAQKKALQDLDTALTNEQQKRNQKNDDIQNDEKISKAQKKAFAEETAKLLTAIQEKGVADTAIINKKFADAQIKEENKNALELLKASLDNAKARIESVNSLDANNSDQELQNLIDLNSAKNALITAQEAQKIEIAIRANGKVLEAEEALKAALATQLEAGGTDRVDAARIALTAIENEVSKSDKVVLDIHRNTLRETQDLDRKFAIEKRVLEAQTIKDDAERERKLKLIEIDKTEADALEKAHGNERLINDAHNKALLDRYDADIDYNRKSTNLAIKTAQTFQDLGISIATGISKSMGSTFDDLNSQFDAFTSDIENKIKGSKDVDKKATEEKANELIDALKKHEISFAEFQKQNFENNKKSNNANVTATEKANLLIIKSFGEMAKSANSAINTTIDAMAKSAKTNAQTIKEKGFTDEVAKQQWEDFSKSVVAVGEDMSLSIAGIFGQMAASGTLTLESAGKAALGITIDTISKLVLAQAPAILAAFASLGPFGFIAGLAAIATIEGLLAVAKSSIGGFEKGGHTGEGGKSEVKGVVHGDEFVYKKSIVHGQVKEHYEMFQLLESGVKLKDILGAYKRPDLSAYSISANGKIVSNNVRNLEQPNFRPVHNVVNVDVSGLQKELSDIKTLLQVNPPRNVHHHHSTDLELKLDRAVIAREQKQALRLERARK